jgi:dipeptidyl aminopeptidase/acylaminoacyl peptidase
MAFTDEVLRRYKGRIDPDRLGVMGGSYGGFMTNWIVGSTDRFAAAVSQRSISSWLSMWGTSDIGYFFEEDQIAGDPWEGREALWRQSPLRLAPEVKTPLLLVHSRQDYRCWEVEAFQFFTAIRYHGGDARLALFDGETHELSRSGTPKPRIRRLEEIFGWFNDRLTK